ncbi:hypothetical protein JD844_006181 [Phrynosoma platyrhinos]|uniref:C-type lectin domain-containing protein n=1 Tax=Phrynosoma platyrhinos TaxID=52577 RepID=A0ABQ7T1A9_PHRPL|nr:hypothetical protein JD844_006181 [Phrynosoma platyrhinos]
MTMGDACGPLSTPDLQHGLVDCRGAPTLLLAVSTLSYHIMLFSFILVLLLQGAVSVGEKIFVSTGQHTFSDGRDLCARAGGALASSRNAAENRALAEIVKKNSKFAFLGINDIQTEGKFVHLNGAPVGYTNWKQGEPNNLNNEDCVVLLENQLWNDFPCEHKSLIICEL